MGRKPLYDEPMVMKNFMLPAKKWETIQAIADGASKKTGLHVTPSDILRTAIDRLIKDASK